MWNQRLSLVFVSLVSSVLLFPKSSYGLILMNAVRAAPEAVAPLTRFAIGLVGGLILGASALHWLIRDDAVLGLTVIGPGAGNYQIVTALSHRHSRAGELERARLPSQRSFHDPELQWRDG